MATPDKLDFYTSGPGWLSASESESEESSPSLNRPAPEPVVEQEPKKKSKKKLVWNEEDELTLLKEEKEDEDVTNANTNTENGGVKCDCNGNVPQKVVVDKRAVKETNDGGDADDLCDVRDAFDAMISQGLSEYQKKLQLEKLMKLETRKRKELSDEWNVLVLEEAKIGLKKLRFCAKLADAAIDS